MSPPKRTSALTQRTQVVLKATEAALRRSFVVLEHALPQLQSKDRCGTVDMRPKGGRGSIDVLKTGIGVFLGSLWVPSR